MLYLGHDRRRALDAYALHEHRREVAQKVVELVQARGFLQSHHEAVAAKAQVLVGRVAHPLLRHQARTLRITEESFIEEIAPARTFTFLKDVEMLRQNGLALGGSLENAIVLGETGVLNNALRFEDEFVRHKILDAIGDLALVGYPVIGHLVAHRAGHALHTEFAAKILEETHAWRLVEAPAGAAALPLPDAVKAAVPRLAN